MNEVQANRGIYDINARYKTEMEGYRTRMSYMRELCVMQKDNRRNFSK